MDQETGKYREFSSPEISKTLLKDITATKDCAYHVNAQCSDIIAHLNQQREHSYIFYEIQHDMTSIISTCNELQKNMEHFTFVCKQNVSDIADIKQQLLQLNNKINEADTRINEFMKLQADYDKQVQEHERQIVMYKSAIRVIFVIGAFVAGIVGIMVNLKNVFSSQK